LKRLTSNEIEAANRAEATAILIRAGYRMYRPEADVSGEDLVIRTPKGELRAVQMKGRPSSIGGTTAASTFGCCSRTQGRHTGATVVLYQTR